MVLDIQDGDVIRLLEDAGGLPTLPNVATRVIEATDGPETTVKEVAGLIEKDMALSAKVLQIINSPFYGFGRGISSVNEAVSLMGFKQVGSIALGLAAMSSLPRVNVVGFDYEQFWERSLANAVSAVMITSRVNREASHGIFTISLLQNIGTYLLARHLPVLHGYALAIADQRDIHIARAELEALGTDHAMVGAHLAGRWNLPPNMTIPIRHHHYLDQDAELDSTSTAGDLLLSIHLLNVASLLSETHYAADEDPVKDLLIERAQDLLGLDESGVNELLADLSAEIASVRLLFRAEETEAAAPEVEYEETCPECTTENGPGHKFCKECGSSLRRVVQQRVDTTPAKRILVAEDSAATRTAISAMLKRMGYEVVVALNGEEAVDLARQVNPDLILMDIMMPVMDGIESLKAIRSEVRLRTIPIVMLTSTTDVRMVTEAIECGANDYIAKPFSVTLLTERVERYIHAR